MNATTLYVSTCRYILQAEFENCETWADLYRLLPYLRQSLSCCVCGALLEDPQGPTDSNCQHFVCRTCVGGKMLLKPSCSWCKDYAKFADVLQLKILLSCYKKLCEYIAATPIARNLVGANGESNSTLTILQEGMAINASHESSNIATDKALNILDILAKANSLDKTRINNAKSPRRRGRHRKRDRESCGVGGSPAPSSGSSGHGSAANPEVGSSSSRLDGLSNGIDGSDHLDMSDDHQSFYSAAVSTNDSPRIKLKRKHHSSEHKSKTKKKKKKRDKDKERKLDGQRARHGSGSRSSSERKKRRHKGKTRRQGSRKSSQSDSATPPTEKLTNGDISPEVDNTGSDTPKKMALVISGHRAKMLKAGKSLPPLTLCRCGTWNRHPGVNTCYGNRCPCYMEERGCFKCKCKGCRNPFAADGGSDKRRHRMSLKESSSHRRDINGDSDLDIDVMDI